MLHLDNQLHIQSVSYENTFKTFIKYQSSVLCKKSCKKNLNTQVDINVGKIVGICFSSVTCESAPIKLANKSPLIKMCQI